jgi:hypothetical protein
MCSMLHLSEPVGQLLSLSREPGSKSPPRESHAVHGTLLSVELDCLMRLTSNSGLYTGSATPPRTRSTSHQCEVFFV